MATATATAAAPSPTPTASPSQAAVIHGAITPGRVIFTLAIHSTVNPTVDQFVLQLTGTNAGQTLFPFCSPGDKPCASGGTYPRTFALGESGTGSWAIQRVVGQNITVVASGTIDLSGDSVSVTY